MVTQAHHGCPLPWAESLATGPRPSRGRNLVHAVRPAEFTAAVTAFLGPAPGRTGQPG